MSETERSDPGLGLTAEAWTLLMAARIGLRALPFGRLRAVARRLARRTPRRKYASPEAIAAALGRGSRLVPRATCLGQALAGAVLLARHGHPAALRIGVASDRPRAVAHAWVESQGAVLVGTHAHGAYTPLPAIEVW